ncbi:MAG: helix-turn-helix transcriptional regulator [Bacteroidota bacterium]
MGDKSGNKDAIALLAKNLKKYRSSSGLSLRQLATASELSLSQVARVEQGDINTSVSTIWELAKGLSIPPSKLLEIPDEH